MDDSNIGKAIKKRRRYLGLTQEELAESTGLPRHTINRLENGKAIVGIDNKKSIAKALGISLELLETTGLELDIQNTVPRQEYDRLKTELMKAQAKIIELQEEIIKLKK